MNYMILIILRNIITKSYDLQYIYCSVSSIQKLFTRFEDKNNVR